MENFETLENEIVSFREAFCLFGYLDIKEAVSQAVSVGFDGAWAFDQIEQFCNECGLKLSDVDLCYIVMDGILQRPANEINFLSGFNVGNDADFYQALMREENGFSFTMDSFRSLATKCLDFTTPGRGRLMNFACIKIKIKIK